MLQLSVLEEMVQVEADNLELCDQLSGPSITEFVQSQIPDSPFPKAMPPNSETVSWLPASKIKLDPKFQIRYLKSQEF